jgi:endonuclease/exonuclease/phosphatase family metal-dependent hydrolase|tara:strand:+ start:373 stop:1281 length:909 start_codon:yes stop_codon:yes gene_type:complete
MNLKTPFTSKIMKSPNIFVFLSSVSLSAALFLSGCSSPTQTSLTLDTMSFNIRYGTAKDGDNHWDKRKELVFDVFGDHQPQIVGVQEALGFQIEEIKSAHSQYTHLGIGRDPNSTGEYSAILYLKDHFDVIESDTFWLSETPEARSTHWGNQIVRICTWAHFRDKTTDRSFYVFNTHFDHKSQESRERSALLIAQRIAERSSKEDPYILMGDFNAGEDNEAILSLLRTSATALVDTFRVLHPKSQAVGTFGAWTGKTDGNKIDYVFVAPTTEVLQAQILHNNTEGRYPSDHYPVTAKLRFPR